MPTCLEATGLVMRSDRKSSHRIGSRRTGVAMRSRAPIGCDAMFENTEKNQAVLFDNIFLCSSGFHEQSRLTLTPECPGLETHRDPKTFSPVCTSPYPIFICPNFSDVIYSNK